MLETRWPRDITRGTEAEAARAETVAKRLSDHINYMFHQLAGVGKKCSLLVQVQLDMPLPPDLRWSKHASRAAHVTKGSLTCTVLVAETMVKRTRLARESAKLNPEEEKQLADEGLSDALDAWPEY